MWAGRFSRKQNTLMKSLLIFLLGSIPFSHIIATTDEFSVVIDQKLYADPRLQVLLLHNELGDILYQFLPSEENIPPDGVVRFPLPTGSEVSATVILDLDHLAVFTYHRIADGCTISLPERYQGSTSQEKVVLRMEAVKNQQDVKTYGTKFTRLTHVDLEDQILQVSYTKAPHYAAYVRVRANQEKKYRYFLDLENEKEWDVNYLSLPQETKAVRLTLPEKAKWQGTVSGYHAASGKEVVFYDSKLERLDDVQEIDLFIPPGFVPAHYRVDLTGGSISIQKDFQQLPKLQQLPADITLQYADALGFGFEVSAAAADFFLAEYSFHSDAKLQGMPIVSSWMILGRIAEQNAATMPAFLETLLQTYPKLAQLQQDPISMRISVGKFDQTDAIVTFDQHPEQLLDKEWRTMQGTTVRSQYFYLKK